MSESSVNATTIIVGGDIKREPRYDSTDNGFSFEGYVYKNCIPITKAVETSSNELYIYICIRSDYINEIPNSEFRLCNYFNGVDRDLYNRRTLVAICEYLYQKYFEKNPNPDTSDIPAVYR